MKRGAVCCAVYAGFAGACMYGSGIVQQELCFFRVNNQLDGLKFHTVVKTCIGQSVFISIFTAEKEQLSHARRGEKSQ